MASRQRVRGGDHPPGRAELLPQRPQGPAMVASEDAGTAAGAARQYSGMSPAFSNIIENFNIFEVEKEEKIT